MLSSKFFSFLALAAVVVAQRFPPGEFVISNAGSPLVLEGGSEAGGPIMVSSHRPGDATQAWSYTNGVLRNQASGLVIEVPKTDDEVNYGTMLVQATPKNESENDLAQLWDYDEQFQHIYTLANTNACVTWNDSMVSASVDFCDRGQSNGQRWVFGPA